MGNNDSKSGLFYSGTTTPAIVQKNVIPFAEFPEYKNYVTSDTADNTLPDLLVKIIHSCGDKYIPSYSCKLLIKYLNDIYPFKSLVSSHGYISDAGHYITFSKYAFVDLMPKDSVIYRVHSDYCKYDSEVKFVLVYPIGCLSVTDYIKSTGSPIGNQTLLTAFHQQISSQIKIMHSYGITHADICLDNIGLYKPTSTSPIHDWCFYLFDFGISFHKDELDCPTGRYEQALSWNDLGKYSYCKNNPCYGGSKNNFLDYEMLLWSELKLIGIFPIPEDTNNIKDENERYSQIQKNQTDIYLWKVNFLLFSDTDYYLKGGKKTPYPSEIKELIW